MTSTLHDQLGRLAERAGDPARGDVDRPSGRELWDRGVRYRRRVRGGTLAILGAALASLAVIVGVTVHRAAPPPEPQPAQAPAGIPSRIWAPSAWLPGTDEAGPLGQTVAVVGATRRGWLGSESGVVGISAATGEYRFLDLPGKASGGHAVLSPDGRHLAYWSTGPTSDTPNTSEGDAPVASVTVYDTATGSTRVARVETEHGVEPELLFWVDDRRLAFSHYQYVGGDDDSQMAQSSGNDQSWWWWDLGDDTPTAWSSGARALIDGAGSSVDGRVVVSGEGGFWVLTGDRGPAAARGPLSGSTLVTMTLGSAVSPDGTRVAGIWNGAHWPADVVVVPLGPDDDLGGARLRGTGGSHGVEGWIDADHLAVTRNSPPSGRTMGKGVFAMDAATGEATRIVRLPPGPSDAVQWATDLLSAPVVDRPAPPRPLDPRVVTGLGVAVVLAAGLGLWGWRRRVAP